MHLTTVSSRFRKGVKAFAAFVVLYYILILLVIPITRKGLSVIIPEKDPPNPIYGQLDPLEFTEKPILSETVKYSLNTKDGRLPAFPKKAPVVKYIRPQFSYEAGKNAQNHALTLGFTDVDLISDLKGSTYKWKSVESGGLLEINKDTKELTLQTPLSGKSSLYPAGTLTETAAVNFAKSLVTSVGRFGDTLYQQGTQTVQFGKFSGNNLVSSNIASEAQIARVDFFRTINKVPVVGADPKVGNIQVWLRKPGSKTSPYDYPIVSAYEWQVEPTTNASYPLVPISQVWAEITKGKGIIVNVTPRDASPFDEYTPVRVDVVYVNNIYIGYYDNIKMQRYLQPIYVFDGNYTSGTGGAGSITLYYPAVDGKYVKAIESK
ncbi:MAG TPA: hypothetical protein VJG85_00135 [Patescibacteria group bacterium]|nr:hypothetical protein [Patescibacteria group bacterium]